MKIHIHTDPEGVSGIDTAEMIERGGTRGVTDTPREFHR